MINNETQPQTFQNKWNINMTAPHTEPAQSSDTPQVTPGPKMQKLLRNNIPTYNQDVESHHFTSNIGQTQQQAAVTHDPQQTYDVQGGYKTFYHTYAFNGEHFR